MRGAHRCMHGLRDRVGVGTFALSSTHLVFSLVFFCKTIVYIGVTAEHESTDPAATNQEMIMKSNQNRICELRIYLEQLGMFKQWCIDAGDWARHENTCLALYETQRELRDLSAK